MKISVCLPSYNEASNIQNITKIVDQGLTTLSANENGLEAVVVNVDSDSSDDIYDRGATHVVRIHDT